MQTTPCGDETDLSAERSSERVLKGARYSIRYCDLYLLLVVLRFSLVTCTDMCSEVYNRNWHGNQWIGEWNGARWDITLRFVCHWWAVSRTKEHYGHKKNTVSHFQYTLSHVHTQWDSLKSNFYSLHERNLEAVNGRKLISSVWWQFLLGRSSCFIMRLT